MKEEVRKMQIENIELRARVKELEEVVTVLKQQLAKIGGLDCPAKEKLLKKILDVHPDCYNQIEFDEAFNEACKNHK